MSKYGEIHNLKIKDDRGKTLPYGKLTFLENESK